MLEILLISIGAVILVSSLVMAMGLRKYIRNQKLRLLWYVLFCLVVFFIIGYVMTIYSLLDPENGALESDLLISLIFFFGSIFVILVIWINSRVLKQLNQRAEVLKKKNAKINMIIKKLRNNNETLLETKEELEKKNVDLNTINKKLRLALDDQFVTDFDLEHEAEDEDLIIVKKGVKTKRKIDENNKKVKNNNVK